MIAKHKIITPNCHEVQGSPEKAIEIALHEIKQSVIDAVKGYGEEANIHIKVEIERLS